MSDKQIEHLLTDDSFVRWLKGHASAKEHEYWIDWIARKESHADMVEQARELVRMTGSEKLTIPDPQIELNKFEASLEEYEQGLKKVNKAKITGIHRPERFIGAAAAFLILLVTSIGFFLYFKDIPEPSAVSQEKVIESRHEFRTDFGEKISLKLSDGSLITLNANSHLKYSSRMQSGQNIDVWLEGEAYFDIAHLEGDRRRVFRVHTYDGWVEVVGTKFVVKASSEGTRTVLEEGEVRINVKNDAKGSDPVLVMKPGELARFISGSDRVDLHKVHTSVYTSWRQGKWDFEQTPLKDVAQRIEDTYGVEVIVRNGELQQKLLSGSIKSTSLEILKEALSKVLDEPVIQQDENTITIGGKQQ